MVNDSNLLVNDSNLLVKVGSWPRQISDHGQRLAKGQLLAHVNCFQRSTVGQGQQLVKASSWPRSGVGQGQKLAKVISWPRSAVGYRSADSSKNVLKYLMSVGDYEPRKETTKSVKAH